MMNGFAGTGLGAPSNLWVPSAVWMAGKAGPITAGVQFKSAGMNYLMLVNLWRKKCQSWIAVVSYQAAASSMAFRSPYMYAYLNPDTVVYYWNWRDTELVRVPLWTLFLWFKGMVFLFCYTKDVKLEFKSGECALLCMPDVHPHASCLSWKRVKNWKVVFVWVMKEQELFGEGNWSYAVDYGVGGKGPLDPSFNFCVEVCDNSKVCFSWHAYLLWSFSPQILNC